MARHVWFLIILMMVLNIGDVLTTYLGLQRGIIEGLPWESYWFATYGFFAVGTVRLFGVGVLLALVGLGIRYRYRSGWVFLILPALMTLAAVWNNITWLTLY